MACFRLLLEHLVWIEPQLLSGIRDSRKAGSLWEMMRGVGGVRKLIHQSWLDKGLRLELLCWGFKGVQEEIPSEEASTLQIGSVEFPPRQCTSPQLHPFAHSSIEYKISLNISNGIVTGTTTLAQSGHCSNGNERVFHTSQITRSRASLADAV